MTKVSLKIKYEIVSILAECPSNCEECDVEEDAEEATCSECKTDYYKQATSADDEITGKCYSTLLTFFVSSIRFVSPPDLVFVDVNCEK